MTIRHTDFWQFIYDYLPGYSSDPDVLWSDILTRYIDGEEVCEKDRKRIETEFPTMDKVYEELDRVDSGLFTDAMNAYCGFCAPIPLQPSGYWDIPRYSGNSTMLIEREGKDLLIINQPTQDDEPVSFTFQLEGDITDEIADHFNSLFLIDTNNEKRIPTAERMNFLKQQTKIKFFQIDNENANRNLIICGGTEMPAIVAGMLKHFYFDNLGGHTTMLDCIKALTKEDVAQYEFDNLEDTYYTKVANFLYSSFTGMRLGSPWNGRAEVNGGYIVVKRDGDVVAYHSTIADEFKDFLVHRLTMEGPSHKRHKDMVIEKVDGKFYLKLALQLRFGMSSRKNN